MEDNTQYFKTKDLGFAAYVKARGVDLIAIEDGQDATDNYKNLSFTKQFKQFVFDISATDPYILNLQDEWENSRHCGEIKRVLYFHKLIKQELFNYKNSSNLPENGF